jgi:hypothetical protein
MDLQEKMNAKKKEFKSSAPKEALEVMHRSTEKLKESGIADRAKGVGDQAPDFSLKNAKGKTVNLKEFLSKGPVVLGFYRGRW